MKNIFFLKLRSNITLDGDIDLAERELSFLFHDLKKIDDATEVEQQLGLPCVQTLLHTKSGIFGFLACQPKVELEKLPLLVNFIQEIWLKADERTVQPDLPYMHTVATINGIFSCLIPFMAAGELLSKSKAKLPNVEHLQKLTMYLAGDNPKKSSAIKAPTAGATSTQHIHSLHKYKAKFFPRLIRSVLVTEMDFLPKTKNGRLKLLDPFVGSGTALIEASMLGMDAYGVDIDKLSCAITQSKLDAIVIDSSSIESYIDNFDEDFVNKDDYYSKYIFPEQIKKKFQRWDALDEQKQYEENIEKWINALKQIDDLHVKPLFDTCLSDALTRKFVIRMMGTGVGRFALEIAKTPLDTIMRKNMQNMLKGVGVLHTMIDAYRLSLGKTEVVHGSAIDLHTYQRLLEEKIIWLAKLFPIQPLG